jgi:hypothetical protein
MLSAESSQTTSTMQGDSAVRGAASARRELWQAVLDRLQVDPAISRASFATWLKGTQLLASDSDAFVVGAQHRFACEKLARSFRVPIEQAIAACTGGTHVRVRFTVRTGGAAGARPIGVYNTPVPSSVPNSLGVPGLATGATAASVPTLVPAPPGRGAARAPSVETRVAILRARAAVIRTALGDPTLELIARRIEGGAAQLERALGRVVVAAQAATAPLTLADVEAAVAAGSTQRPPTPPNGTSDAGPATRVDHGPVPRRSLGAPIALPPMDRATHPAPEVLAVGPQPEAVLRAVARCWGVAAADLAGKRRDRETVVPRQVAMFLMRDLTGASLAEIGALLGGRDHSTVLHGCERVAGQLGHDEALRRLVEAARRLAGGPPGPPAANGWAARLPPARAAAPAAAH